MTLGHGGLDAHDLVEDVVLRADQALLDALDDFFALHLVPEVLLEHLLPVALAVQFEVRRPVDEVLVNVSQLAGHRVALANVKHTLRLSVG